LGALAGIAERADLHGLIDGRLTRILLDAERLPVADVARRMSRAMSPGNAPSQVAGWVEGLLSGGGLLLVHDAGLLSLVDEWLTGLTDQLFVDVLPLLRRTFGAFAGPERRAIGERVAARPVGGRRVEGAVRDVDEARAAPAVRAVLTILGRT
jgi:hypothetical protein